MTISIIPDVSGVGNSIQDSEGLNNNFKIVQQSKSVVQSSIKDLGTQEKSAKEFGHEVDMGNKIGMTKVNTAESTKALGIEIGKGGLVDEVF